MSVVPPSAGSDTPYCNATQFLLCYDYRTIAQLCSDRGTSATKAELLDSTTPPGAILDYALRCASGNLETAVLKGGMYAVSDLQNVTGQATNPNASANANNNAAAFLRGLVAAYAKYLLYCHRPELMVQIPADVQQAAANLAALARGELILPIQPAIDAGHLFVETETSQIVENRRLVPITMQRYFGRRNNDRCNGGY